MQNAFPLTIELLRNSDKLPKEQRTNCLGVFSGLMSIRGGNTGFDRAVEVLGSAYQNIQQLRRQNVPEEIVGALETLHTKIYEVYVPKQVEPFFDNTEELDPAEAYVRDALKALTQKD